MHTACDSQIRTIGISIPWEIYHSFVLGIFKTLSSSYCDIYSKLAVNSYKITVTKNEPVLVSYSTVRWYHTEERILSQWETEHRRDVKETYNNIHWMLLWAGPCSAFQTLPLTGCLFLSTSQHQHHSGLGVQQWKQKQTKPPSCNLPPSKSRPTVSERKKEG